MQRVNLKPDTLDAENARFVQAPLAEPLFLNSIPKSGSHLLRNIVRMFVPVAQQYAVDFIQYPTLQRHLAAFRRDPPMLSWGHLLFSDISAIELAGVRKILLVRDPHSWVLARARFFLSGEFRGPLEHLKNPAIGTEQLLNMMIFGVHQKVPSLAETYTHNAVAWLGTDAHMIRYEDVLAHVKSLDTPEAGRYFTTLLEACGIALTADWRERVRIGADPAQSGTARENLSGPPVALPAELPEAQRALVDHVAPGLRRLLGYG